MLVHEFLERSADRSPDKLALVYAGRLLHVALALVMRALIVSICE